MPSDRSLLLPIAAALAIGAAAAGYAVYEWTHGDAATPPSASLEQALVGTTPALRPEFMLADLQGAARNIREWDGKVLLINFWATWCPPCRREIPAFIEIQEAYGDRGLQIVGIAIDEQDPVRDFVDETGINYPILIGAEDAIEVSRAYGNRFGALPYSVIIDRQGRVITAKGGELTRDEAEQMLKPLL